MSNIRLSIPKELRLKIKDFPKINWSFIARNALIQKLREIEFINDFKSKSELTDEDAVIMGQKVSLVVGKKYLKKFKR